MALGEGRTRALLVVGLLVLVGTVFAPMRDHAWLNYDDDVYVTANPGVHQGLSVEGLRWAFTTFHGANWFPLTRLSWQANHSVSGLERRGYATTNLLLHTLATLALFLALARMTGAPGRSAFVAAVFAVHPLQVEPVAWVAARKDPLAGACFALALLAYSGLRERPTAVGRLWLVAVCLVLGLLSKQTIVTLPVLLLLLDEWPLGRLRRQEDPQRFNAAAVRRCVLEKLPLLALAAGAGVMTVLAQSSAGVIAKVDELPMALRLGNAAVSAVAYLRKLILPTDLAVFYPHPGELPAPQVVGAVALLAVLTAGALALLRRQPAVTVGWLWYGIALLPVIGIVQVGSQSMADRYMYLPIIGLAIAVAWGVPALVAHLTPRQGLRHTALTIGACAAIAALAFGASLQLRHWRDSESLMRRALDVTEANFIAHAHLGAALLGRGQTLEAAEQWRESARVNPGYATVANNLAWLLATHQDRRIRAPEEAVVHAERAARIQPDDPAVLDTLAAAYAAAGRFDAAVATASRAAELVREEGDRTLAAAIEARRDFYRRGRSWREP